MVSSRSPRRGRGSRDRRDPDPLDVLKAETDGAHRALRDDRRRSDSRDRERRSRRNSRDRSRRNSRDRPRHEASGNSHHGIFRTQILFYRAF